MRFIVSLIGVLFASSAFALPIEISGSVSCNSDWEITGDGSAMCRDLTFSGSVTNGVSYNDLNARILYNPEIANALCVDAGYTMANDAQFGVWDASLPRMIGENWIITLNEKLEVAESKWRPSNGTPFFQSLTCE